MLLLFYAISPFSIQFRGWCAFYFLLSDPFVSLCSLFFCFYFDMSSPALPSAIRALHRIGFQAVLPTDGYFSRSLFHVADLYDRLISQNIVDSLRCQRQKVGFLLSPLILYLSFFPLSFSYL